jgi:hypothetical protein
VQEQSVLFIRYTRSTFALSTILITVALLDEVRSAGSPGVALSQFEKAGICAGFVLGVSEMLTRPFACIPNSVPAEQLVQAVVNFAERQPETMKDDFGLLVGAALSVTWPCPKDK